jgi:hypothetical protein
MQRAFPLLKPTGGRYANGESLPCACYTGDVSFPLQLLQRIAVRSHPVEQSVVLLNY